MMKNSKKKSENQIISEFHDKYNRRDGVAGKGDSPRSIFSEKYQNNYDDINWSEPKTQKKNIQKKEAIVDDRQKKYAESDKGKEARLRARKKYDDADIERRRRQKREYMRRKREENPNYCKWK